MGVLYVKDNYGAAFKENEKQNPSFPSSGDILPLYYCAYFL